MRARQSLVVAAFLGWWLAGVAHAQEGVRWQPTVDAARRLAEQTNRLVLIHFWSDGCPPCLMMERDVFPRPEVAAALERDFVAVKVNRSYFPATAAQYGITAVPADVVITPQGQVLDKHVGFLLPPEYISTLAQVAERWRNASGTQYAQMPPGPPVVTPGRVVPRYDSPIAAGLQPGAMTAPGGPGPAGQTPPIEPRPEAALLGPRYAGQAQPGFSGPPGGSYVQPPMAPAYAAPAAAGQSPPSRGPGAPIQSPGVAAYPPPMPPYQNPVAMQHSGSSIQQPRQPGVGNVASQSSSGPASAPPPASARDVRIPEGNPPLALDGFCPVQLKEKERWVPGDVRWGARHEGRTYLFSGPEEQKRFFEHPEIYAPVMSGIDVVLAVEQGQSIPGRREFGGWYKGKMYLFSSEECYQRFAANPQRYTAAMASLGQPSPSLANRDLPGSSNSGWQGNVVPAQASALGGRY